MEVNPFKKLIIIIHLFCSSRLTLNLLSSQCSKYRVVKHSASANLLLGSLIPLSTYSSPSWLRGLITSHCKGHIIVLLQMKKGVGTCFELFISSILRP